MSPYTIMLRKINSYTCKKAARKSAKTAGNNSGGKSGGLYCVYRQKGAHSNVFPYFTDLPVSSSL